MNKNGLFHASWVSCFPYVKKYINLHSLRHPRSLETIRKRQKPQEEQQRRTDKHVRSVCVWYNGKMTIWNIRMIILSSHLPLGKKANKCNSLNVKPFISFNPLAVLIWASLCNLDVISRWFLHPSSDLKSFNKNKNIIGFLCAWIISSVSFTGIQSLSNPHCCQRREESLMFRSLTLCL